MIRFCPLHSIIIINHYFVQVDEAFTVDSFKITKWLFSQLIHTKWKLLTKNEFDWKLFISMHSMHGNLYKNQNIFALKKFEELMAS